MDGSRSLILVASVALLGMGFGTAKALDAPPKGAETTLAATTAEDNVALVIDAMAAHRPKLNKGDAARFASVLKASRGTDSAAVESAWEAFAVAYFNAETNRHRRALELVVFAAALGQHAPVIAKSAGAAASARRKVALQKRRTEALRSALDNAKGKSEPVDGLRAQLSKATAALAKLDKAYNLQHLQLQQDMQAQNRQFTLVSNIMKTRHDTAKNAISNIR
ncbi:MAG: hypothetical protein AAF721_29395 [Myxococcota bacterium]